MTSKLLYERVNKKVTGQGYPDSKNVKLGSTQIKLSPGLHGLAAGSAARWLAGDVMTLADFTAAAHPELSGLHQRWTGTGTPC